MTSCILSRSLALENWKMSMDASTATKPSSHQMPRMGYVRLAKPQKKSVQTDGQTDLPRRDHNIYTSCFWLCNLKPKSQHKICYLHQPSNAHTTSSTLKYPTDYHCERVKEVIEAEKSEDLEGKLKLKRIYKIAFNG